MSRFVSPLRYPGGKGKMYKVVKNIIIDNNFNNHVYTEPFVGGAAVGLRLLTENVVERIVINDLDKSIYAFWYSVLNHTNELINLIEGTNVSLSEWSKQKEIQLKKNTNDNLLEIGFSTLFLNRTNRSGVLTGGPIGGHHQSGDYKIDCRFNKTDLIDRILRIANMRDRIELFNLDATDLIRLLNTRDEDYFIYMDPPYYEKGKQLYLNFFNHNDHVILKNEIELSRHPWIITYDNVVEISEIYIDYHRMEFDLQYSAGNVKVGKEILINNNTININPNIFNKSTI